MPVCAAWLLLNAVAEEEEKDGMLLFMRSVTFTDSEATLAFVLCRM
jgi:hypothetical protein